MGNEWPPTDWTKATRADWDRAAEESARLTEAKYARMSDEELLKEIEQEWDGPISVSPAHFYKTMGIDPSEAPPQKASGSRTSAISRLAGWIAKKLALVRSSDIRPS